MSDNNSSLSIGEALRNLCTQIGGNYDGAEVRVTTEGRDFFFSIYLPVRGGAAYINQIGVPSFFELRTKIPYAHPNFCIRKADKTVDYILDMPTYLVGDSVFDSEFHIKVENSNWGNQFFSDNSIRACISDLLLQEFDVIRSEDGDLKIIKYLPIGSSYPNAGQINDAIKKVGQIISIFPDCGVYSNANYQNVSELLKPISNDYLKSHKDAEEILLQRKRRLGCIAILVYWAIAIAVLCWLVTRSIGNIAQFPFPNF